MQVRDIMTRQIISLKPDENAHAALKRILELKISGLPVIDEKGKLCGMFTEKEVITRVLPSYLGKVGSFAYIDDPKALKQKMSELSGLKVRDVMRKEVATVLEDTGLAEVAHLMVSQRARRVMVLNAKSDLVGLIARGDVIKALFEEPGHKQG